MGSPHRKGVTWQVAGNLGLFNLALDHIRGDMDGEGQGERGVPETPRGVGRGRDFRFSITHVDFEVAARAGRGVDRDLYRKIGGAIYVSVRELVQSAARSQRSSYIPDGI